MLAIMPKKKDKFYIYILWITKSYNTLKSCSHGTYTLILKLQETSPGCLADLFVSRLIYIFVNRSNTGGFIIRHYFGISNIAMYR